MARSSRGVWVSPKYKGGGAPGTYFYLLRIDSNRIAIWGVDKGDGSGRSCVQFYYPDEVHPVLTCISCRCLFFIADRTLDDTSRYICEICLKVAKSPDIDIDL